MRLLIKQPGSQRAVHLSTTVIIGIALVFSSSVRAASDEIQVYSSDIRNSGEPGVDVHVNYARQGVKTREWADQTIAHHALNITPEFSWHLADKMDWGLYLPTTRTADGNWIGNGIKGRVKYIDTLGDATNNIFWGVNFELSRNRPSVSESLWSTEVRLILGRETEGWLFVSNILLGNDLSGTNRSGVPDLSMNGTVLRKFGDKVSAGVEHHAEIGKTNDLQPWNNTPETTFLVGNYEGKGWGIHLGAGHNWTNVGDKLVYKAIVSADF